MDLSMVRELARSVPDDTASHVRQSILELAEMDTGALTVLLSEPFTSLVPTVPITTHVYGSFLGPADSLAAPGQEYPHLDMTVSIDEFGESVDGSHPVKFGGSWIVSCGEGVSFRLERREVWGVEPREE
ncbi:MAG: hypothetical protein GY720_10230 [bacterium]|nr:hypothetical protein [bacterium]